MSWMMTCLFFFGADFKVRAFALPYRILRSRNKPPSPAFFFRSFRVRLAKRHGKPLFEELF